MDLVSLVETGNDILIWGTVAFGAIGLFELFRPNPKIKP
jgi:hypothetical protein